MHLTLVGSLLTQLFNKSLLFLNVDKRLLKNKVYSSEEEVDHPVIFVVHSSGFLSYLFKGHQSGQRIVEFILLPQAYAESVCGG